MTETFFRDWCPLWKSLLWPSLHYKSLSPPFRGPQRKTLVVCCPHVISSSRLFRLMSTGCRFLCVLSVLRDGGTIVMFTLTEGGFGFENMSKTNLVLVLKPIKHGDCILWGTLHNQRHTDTSKRTTWLPHKRFDRTNTPPLQSFTNIKPYAYLRVKRGRTFYWLNCCLCSLS